MSTFIHLRDLRSAIENAISSYPQYIFEWDVIGFSADDVLANLAPCIEWDDVREADEGFTVDDTENGYVYAMEYLEVDLEDAFEEIRQDPDSFCSYPIYYRDINNIFESNESECEDAYAEYGYDANSDFRGGGVQSIIDHAVCAFVSQTFYTTVMEILEEVQKELG